MQTLNTGYLLLFADYLKDIYNRLKMNELHDKFIGGRVS